MGVRTVLVGLGRMGRTHLRALERTDRLEVVAVVDPSPEAGQRVEGSGITSFRSVEDALGSSRFDAAVVAAPTGAHLEIVRTLSAAGIHVLCEKPCGLSPAEALAAGEAAASAGVVLQVGFWRRFVPALARLRERIAIGELGEIMQVSCFQWDERPPPAAFRAASGGILIDMGVHEFDEIRWLTGQDVIAAATFSSSVRVDPPVPGDVESVGVVAGLSEGAVALVSLGRRHVPGETVWVSVIGTAGTEEVSIVRPPKGDAPMIDALVTQAEVFADAVAGAPLRGASAADAAAALEAAHAAIRRSVDV